MNSLSETWVCLCAIAFVSGNSLVRAANANSRDGNKRDLGMLRLGRGLQMLRLGKRSTNLDTLNLDHPDQTNTRLSSSDVQAVLSSIFDQPRDESRRQPPLPRYGRDSNNNIKGRLLDNAVADGTDIYQADFFPFSNQRFFFRPAPRGGRYRRSLPSQTFAYGDYISQDDSARSVAFPRFEPFVDDIADLRPKAVPRPRIGRYQNDLTVNSFRTKVV